jgi:hypothetical protein
MSTSKIQKKILKLHDLFKERDLHDGTWMEVF